MSHHNYYIGDSLEVLKTLPDKGVHCCVTSPPYWGLRDYGVPGQIGLEPTPEEYVSRLVDVFREVRRVLRDDGTLWLNLGDSYTSGGRNSYDHNPRPGRASRPKGGLQGGTLTVDMATIPKPGIPEGLKPKDLVGIPWLVAFALRADGWYLRSDIIWHKPNPMPESVTDRPTKAHEYIFLLAKSERYYYDADAIKEPVTPSTIDRGKVDFGGKKGREYKPVKGDPNYRAGHEQWGRTFDYRKSCVNGRNKRTVWTVATQPFLEAHFATFPPDLIRPCILAGTSPQSCPVCGAPWKRVIEKTGHKNNRESAHVPNNTPTKTDSTGWAPTTRGTDKFIPSCTCSNNDGSGKCIILDPFGGAGTTSLVAKQHGRNSIYIDINPEYTKIAIDRMNFEQGDLFKKHSYEVISMPK